jgi:hypothetical protein
MISFFSGEVIVGVLNDETLFKALCSFISTSICLVAELKGKDFTFTTVALSYSFSSFAKTVDFFSLIF